MNHLCSEPVPVPVSLSVVVICDLRVLARMAIGDSQCYFPTCYFNGLQDGVDIGEKASQYVASLVSGDYKITNWLPVDVRSRNDRVNSDGKYSLNIGMLAIMDSVDLPTVDEGCEWLLVNLDEEKFPINLRFDHGALWHAAREMFNIMR